MADPRWTPEDEYQFRLEALRRDILYGDGPMGRRNAEVSRMVREQYPDGSPVVWVPREPLEDGGGNGG